MSGTSGGAAPTYTIYTREGVNYLTLRVQFYPNEWNSDTNPNECNSDNIFWKWEDGKEPTPNIGRAIVKKLAVKFEGNEILSIDDFDIFACYQDL